MATELCSKVQTNSVFSHHLPALLPHPNDDLVLEGLMDALGAVMQPDRSMQRLGVRTIADMHRIQRGYLMRKSTPVRHRPESKQPAWLKEVPRSLSKDAQLKRREWLADHAQYLNSLLLREYER